MNEVAFIASAIAFASFRLLSNRRRIACGINRLADRLDPKTGPSPIDEVHQQYLDGEIDERELEERLAVLVDDRAATIRDMADDADGIGEELSKELAREFDSVADLKAADSETLQRIDGIGRHPSGETATLDSIDITVENTGDIPLNYETIEVEVDGATASGDVALLRSLKPGRRDSHLTYFTNDITTEPGTYDMTVRVVSDSGETLASDTVQISSE